MIDNNITKALGAGSGIDSASLVKQLTDLERLGPQQRIDSKREKAEAQISDFGTLTSAIDTLRSSITTLTNKEGLFSKSAAFSDRDNILPTKLDTDVQPGSYAFTVNRLAQAHSMTFGGLASDKDAVGTGTLTFTFGQWERADGVPPAFKPDANAEAFSITIDNSNNSLIGLRDAINKAGKGVQASIINDGTSQRLVVTAPSGGKSELQITVEEDGDTPSNTDATGLSRFAFNADATGFPAVETQKGLDALITINGLSVSRPSNTVTDLVKGLSLDLLKAEEGKVTTITITDDKAFAEENIRKFVEAYNTFLKDTQALTGYNKEEKAWGSLRNDPLAKSVMSRFRSVISSAIPGLSDSNFTALASAGIRTELNGTLSIHEETFRKAMNENFADVQKLFAPHTNSSTADVVVNSYGKHTRAGSYEVNITTPPARGYFNGSAAAADWNTFNTGSDDYSFTVKVNGITSDLISLAADTEFGSAEEMAEALQIAINSDAKLTAQGASVAVTWDETNNRFDITSKRYGAASGVNIVNSSAMFESELGLAAGLGTAGVDVKGTINGVEGFGLGNVLLPKLGEPAEGLSLLIGENATSGKVEFSRGFAGEFEEQVKQFLQTNGLIDSREKELNRQLGDLDIKEEQLERKMSIYQERLMRQFVAMERILSSLNSQGGFLEGLIDRLPFTAKKD